MKPPLPGSPGGATSLVPPPSLVVSRRGFATVQVGAVGCLAALGLLFALYPWAAGLDLSGMDGFGLAGANAEDPAMAGAAPPDMRLKIALFGALGLFNLNAEGSFATWWSSFNLAVAAVLCFLSARGPATQGRLVAGLWRGLAVVMLCLSIDEVAQIHERINKAQFVFGVLFEGVPSRPWVIFGGALAALVAVAAVPLLLSLPRRAAGLMVLSGALFLAGTIGLEVATAAIEDAGAGQYSPVVLLSIVVEETLEMGAIVLFNWVLFDQLVPRRVDLRLRASPVPELVAVGGQAAAAR